jgi:hypothetical protein
VIAGYKYPCGMSFILNNRIFSIDFVIFIRVLKEVVSISVVWSTRPREEWSTVNRVFYLLLANLSKEVYGIRINNDYFF